MENLLASGTGGGHPAGVAKVALESFDIQFVNLALWPAQRSDLIPAFKK
jgi:hypothetical protein